MTAAWHRVALSLLVDLIILDADVGSLAKLAAGALRMEVGIRQVGVTAAETLLPRIAETAMVLGPNTTVLHGIDSTAAARSEYQAIQAVLKLPASCQDTQLNTVWDGTDTSQLSVSQAIMII